MSNLKQIQRAKRWSELFNDRVEELRIEKQQERDDKQFVPEPEDPSSYSCARTLQTLGDPPKLHDWKTHWGTQLLCYFCGLPCLNDVMKCRKCNNIVHTICLYDAKASTTAELILQTDTMSTSDGSIISSELYPQTDTAKAHDHSDHYICPSCEETYKYEKSCYDQLAYKLFKEQRQKHAAFFIGMRIKVFLERCRYKKQKLMLIRMQSMLRRFIARAKFRVWRSTQQRSVVLTFRGIPYWAMHHGLVVVSGMDSYKGVHVFRYDKLAEEAMKESFFLAGVTAQMTISVSIALKEHPHDSNSNTYVVIAQTQLDMRDSARYLYHNQQLNLTLTDLMKVLPNDIKGGVDRLLISTEMAYQNLQQQQQQLLLSALSIGSASPHYKQFLFSKRFIERCLLDDKILTLSFEPSNPVLSYSILANAPPLDVLKKTAEAGFMKKKTTAGNGTNYRTSRYWICIHQGRIMFFQYYGDAKPRFICNLFETTAAVVRDREGHPAPLLYIHHGEAKVSWMIEFKTKYEVFRMETAINESIRAKQVMLSQSTSNDNSNLSSSNSVGTSSGVNTLYLKNIPKYFQERDFGYHQIIY